MGTDEIVQAFNLRALTILSYCFMFIWIADILGTNMQPNWGTVSPGGHSEWYALIGWWIGIKVAWISL